MELYSDQLPYRYVLHSDLNSLFVGEGACLTRFIPCLTYFSDASADSSPAEASGLPAP